MRRRLTMSALVAQVTQAAEPQAPSDAAAPTAQLELDIATWPALQVQQTAKSVLPISTRPPVVRMAQCHVKTLVCNPWPPVRPTACRTSYTRCLMRVAGARACRGGLPCGDRGDAGGPVRARQRCRAAARDVEGGGRGASPAGTERGCQRAGAALLCYTFRVSSSPRGRLEACSCDVFDQLRPCC